MTFPDSLITSYDLTIPFQQEMQASGDVITKEYRLLERFFDKLLSAIKNN